MMREYFPDKISLKIDEKEIKGFSPNTEIKIMEEWEPSEFELCIFGFDHVSQDFRILSTGVINEEKLNLLARLARKKDEIKMNGPDGKLIVHLTNLKVKTVNRNNAE